MSRGRKDEGLTAEELKKRMYQSLQSAGVLNNLKGYLRQSVINELRGRYKKENEVESDSDLLAATMKTNADASWNQKAIDNLILHHLKQSRYLYSLSLFQQEAQIDQYDESLTEELLLRLGASPDLLNGNNKENDRSFPSPHLSSTPVAVGDESKPLMWRILSRISSAQNLATKMDQNSLREHHKKPKPMSLADKLQAVDDEMDGTLRERRHGDIEHRKSIATLASATRRAEEAAEKRARESFEQWKKVEMASMRVKEQEKAKEQVMEKTRQLESDFAQRKEALVLREKNAIERLNNQRESLEKDLHQQRQLLLHELEQIRVREKSLHEKEQMLRDTEAVKLRELDLMKSEVLSQGRATLPGRTRRDSAVSSCAESLRRSLTGKESLQLDEVLRELDSRSNEAKMLRRELMTMKDELADTKKNLKLLSEPKPSPRHVTTSPRDEKDQSLRKRLDDLTKQLNDWKNKDRAEKEETIQSEIARWRSEVSKLSDACDQLDEKQRQLEEMTARVSAKLNTTPRGGGILHSGQLPATGLRVLMDPLNDITREPSIRDYDPVQKSHVRWADEMPYSVRPDLLGKSSRSHRYLNQNIPNIDLDSSNDTTSSDDLSASGLRRDIREKFKDLEKESEDLEQMYKRYIQSNYKHISSDIPGQRSPRPSPRTMGRTQAAARPARQPPLVHRSTLGTEKDLTLAESKPGRRKETELRKPSPTRRQNQASKKPEGPKTMKTEDGLNESQGPLDLETLEKKADSPERPKSSKPMDEPLIFPDLSESGPKDSSGSDSLERPKSSKRMDEPPIFPDLLESGPKDSSRAPPSGGYAQNENSGSADLESDSSVSEKAVPHESEPKFELSEVDSGPCEKSMTHPKTLPPILPRKEKSAVGTVSELLIGDKVEGSSLAEKTVPSVDDIVGENPRLQEDSASAGMSLPMQKSPYDQDSPKSPFERPALLERKREELQRSSDPLKSPVRDQESPIRGSKLQLDLHDDDRIQNILHSIDVNSARSLEGEADPKLSGLLSQLEPQPAVTSQGEVAQPEPKQTVTDS